MFTSEECPSGIKAAPPTTISQVADHDCITFDAPRVNLRCPNHHTPNVVHDGEAGTHRQFQCPPGQRTAIPPFLKSVLLKPEGYTVIWTQFV